MKKTACSLAIIAGVTISGSVWAQSNVPDTIRVPAGHKVLFKANAKDVQIYSCQPVGAGSQKFVWKHIAPDAVLYDEKGRRIGRHYAGPTWEGVDGSKVVGQLKARVDAPGGDSVAWLLVAAKTTSGQGGFGKVSYLNRIDTNGGKAPETGCDVKHAGKIARSAYASTYVFYTVGLK